MILLALVSTFLLFHLHFTPDNVPVAAGITIAILTAGHLLDEKVALEDRIKKQGKYKYRDTYDEI